MRAGVGRIHSSSDRLRRVGLRWLTALMVALLLSQWLGLVHRYLHGGARLSGAPLVSASVATRTLPTSAPAAIPAIPANASVLAWADGLLAVHDSQGDCALFDGLGLTDGPTVAWPKLAMSLPAPRPSHGLTWRAPDPDPSTARARGPPPRA